MVSTTMKENGIQNNEHVLGLPVGDYRLIGWDLDTTGRRLIDEICQIAAFSPAHSFSQYVMPFRDLNPAARRRHNIKVVTVRRYRMLKDTKTGKVLKTKCEISALMDFIQWLETVKGSAADGVILVSYEPRKVAAPLLLEALRRYNLVEKFSEVVTGFANGYTIAEIKCAKTVRSFSLRTLSRVLLDKEEDLCNATDRARLVFQIVQHLCGSEDRPENSQGSGDAGDAASLVDAVRQFTHTVTKEESELAGLKTVLERQNSLRPVFGQMLRVNRRERQRASTLRRILAEAGVNYEMLTAAYAKEGKQSISELLASKVTQAKPKEIEELRELLVGHFDPDSKPKIENKVETSKENIKAGAGDASGSSTPDTITSSPVKAPSSSGDTNTNTNNSPQSNTTSRKRSVSAGPVVTSSPESTAS